jgi:hypothetical protein
MAKANRRLSPNPIDVQVIGVAIGMALVLILAWLQ